MTNPNVPQYPNYPGGAGQQPGQASYPGGSQQAGASPMPGYPAYPGYPGGDGGISPEPPASGATGIIAGVLALLGVLVHGYLILNTIGDIELMLEHPVDTARMVANIAIPVLLLVGGIMILMRRMAGRYILAGTSAVTALYFIGLGIWLVSLASETPVIGESSTVIGGLSAGAFLWCVPAVTTFILTVVPPTGRWIRQGQAAQGRY